ncbi:hypothetical protein K438DRAFT_1812645 [Mycena galopus ATCC 62051]|nr:hypothetical protein K438DRAFT_1812645 [Mycena galopus ATCC 62051]
MRINSVPILILWAQLVDLTLDGGCGLLDACLSGAGDATPGVGSNAGIRISSRVLENLSVEYHKLEGSSCGHRTLRGWNFATRSSPPAT